MRPLFFFTCLLFFKLTNAQFAPAVGQLGSTAMYKDSSAFVNWANACTVFLGPQDISNDTLGNANSGDSTMALGKAMDNGVVSLGDGGFAICRFPHPIGNGIGFDFAVFENSFEDFFLELAFVEISSNGMDFFRFPSTSLTDTLHQIGAFDYLQPTQLNNLAGKYRLGYGTPFDLEEMSNIPNLDINNISYIKIIDVIGSLQNQFCSRDKDGRKINDPWPTPYFTGGFDLDAIGVIHQNYPESIKEENKNEVFLFPNPLLSNQTLRIKNGSNFEKIELSTLYGETTTFKNLSDLNSHELSNGTYFVRIFSGEKIYSQKLIINR